MKLSDIKRGYAGMNAGAWVGDIPFPLFGGIRLKVRRLWNPDYQALHDKLEEERGEVAQVDRADTDREITDECLISTCLLGWEGVDDAYTADAARDLLADPEAGPSFRSAVIYAANHVGDAVKTQMEADAKNSVKL